MDDEMLLQNLMRDGYIVVPHILNESEVSSMISIVEEERRRDNNSYTLFSTSQELLSIFKDKILPKYLSLLVEDPKFHKGTEQSHIAVNPCAQDNLKYSKSDRPIHIDGAKVNLDDDGVQLNGGILQNSFTVLCGVALTDQSDATKGCLEVIPGSHKCVAAFFRLQRGESSSTIIGPGHGDWPAGAAVPPPTKELQPPILNDTNTTLVPILMNPGDLVILCYHLLHRRGYNVSDSNRINLYWRVDANECAKMKAEERNDFLVDEFSGLKIHRL